MSIWLCWWVCGWVVLYLCWLSSCVINCWERSVDVYKCNWEFVHFLSHPVSFASHILQLWFLVHANLWLLHLLVGWPFYYYIASLTIFFVLKLTWSHTGLITPVVFWIFFHSLTFNVPTSYFSEFLNSIFISFTFCIIINRLGLIYLCLQFIFVLISVFCVFYFLFPSFCGSSKHF